MNPIASLDTRSGIKLNVRPVREEDAASLTEFFHDVAEDDRRFRFFTSTEYLTPEQLDTLLHTGSADGLSVVAFDSADSRLVASALLAWDKNRDTGEIAVSIARAYKGKGLGWALLDYLAEQARDAGLRRVISIEDRANHQTIELEREKGFVLEPFDGDESVVILSKTFR